jgi:hypothetical protein
MVASISMYHLAERRMASMHCGAPHVAVGNGMV